MLKKPVWAAYILATLTVTLALTACLSDDEDEIQGASTPPKSSVIGGAIADAIVIPAQSADLSLAVGGIVGEIFVSDGDQVEAGQLLMRLDADRRVSAVTQTETALAVAQAKLAQIMAAQAKIESDEEEARPVELAAAMMGVRSAQETLNHVSGASQAAGAALTPQEAVKDAERASALAHARKALRDAQDALLDALALSETSDILSTPRSLENKAARETTLAEAGLALFEAQEALVKAKDVREILQDAGDDVGSAQTTLDTAHRNVRVTQLAWDQRIRVAQDLFDDASEAYRSVHEKWLGVDLTDEEIVLDLVPLFEEWDLDLDSVFDKQFYSTSTLGIPDDSSTRWSEPTVFAWLFFHPEWDLVIVTCGAKELPPQHVCIEREIDDAWDVFVEQRDSLETVETQAATAVAGVQDSVIGAQDALENAEEQLGELKSERLAAQLVEAEARVEDAQATVRVLEVPDALDVSTAEAGVTAAEKALAYLEFWPDPLMVAQAEAELASLQIELGKLDQGRDPLDVTLDEAAVRVASAQVAAAEAAVALARANLEAAELRAPFSGTAVSVEVDVGEHISVGQVVARLADTSTWRIETENLDELDAVNLQEGDRVLVTFDALRDVVLAGSVTSLSRFGETKRGSVTYTAEIELDEQDPRLRWNMTAAVRNSAPIERTGASRRTQ